MIFRTNYIIRCLMTIWCTARLDEDNAKADIGGKNRAVKVKVNYSICHFTRRLTCASSFAGVGGKKGANGREARDIYPSHFSHFPSPQGSIRIQTTGSLFECHIAPFIWMYMMRRIHEIKSETLNISLCWVEGEKGKNTFLWLLEIFHPYKSPPSDLTPEESRARLEVNKRGRKFLSGFCCFPCRVHSDDD